jgi:hypothetical protein
MKVLKEDGSSYYYYYKKRVGRPKKRGRKKKKKTRGRSWQEKWNFKIIKCSFNKQVEFIGIFHNLIEIEQVKKEIIKRNDEVIFPKTYVNNNTTKNHYNSLLIKNEYLILERIETSSSSSTPKLTNEFGKYIEHTTNSDIWKIYDKLPCVEEESFWVYGYHPKRERKTFKWIYENLLINTLLETSSLLRIFIYKNKIFFRQNDGYFDFVVCKNISDTIKMYNKLIEWCNQNKIKKCFFTGEVQTCSERGKLLIKDLQEKTGWSLRKIRSKST